MTYTVTRAGIGDLEALLPLVAAYRRFYERPPDPDGERAFAAARLAGGSGIVFLARDAAAEAAGFAQLFSTFSTVWLGPSLILEDLFVSPAHRRAGVAAHLLECALRYARDAGATGMFLETAFDNAAAQRAYERAGWTREARFLKYNAPLA